MKIAPVFALRHRLLAAAAGLTVFLTAAACGSTDEGTATAASQPAASPPAASQPVATVASAVTDAVGPDLSAEPAAEATEEPTADPSEEPAEDGGDAGDSGDSGNSGDAGDTSGICGLVSADDVNAVVDTADFDTTTDTSVDDAQACTYTNTYSTYGMTITVNPLATYLGGDLAGDSEADALAGWGSTQELFISDIVTTPLTVGGLNALTVTGTSSILATPVAVAGLISDGRIISVSADGDTLSEDAAGLGGFAAAVLEVALPKLG